MTTNLPLSDELIAEANARGLAALDDEYAALGRKLERAGLDIAAIKDRVAGFSVAVPSWGAGRGGTRFAKFPIPGEPTNIHEKLEDCAVINQLCRMTPRASPHFPWDKVNDYKALREEAAEPGLGFDAVNSNTFQDQPGQVQTYATGSLSSTVEATRQQAVEHNIECIEIGVALGARDLTVRVGDGTNFPGQQDFTRSLDRYLDSGSINPHQQFLVFNELVGAEQHPRDGFDPSYMIDQLHNVTDPIESMLSSAEAITASFAKALLVDRDALDGAQEANDTMMAFQAMRRPYNIDVGPILAKARLEAGGAIDVLGAYRESRWRERKAQERKPVGLGDGIV